MRNLSIAALAATVLPALAQSPEATTPLLQRVADANDFAGDLQRQLGLGNTFCSPFSVSAAFAICWAACDGDTHRDIGKVLHLSQQPAAVHGAMAELQRTMMPAKPPYELSLANRLWGRADAPSGYYQEPFLASMRQHYGACFAKVDFHHAEAARTEINGWVGEQTHERIPDLIPPGGVDGSTVFVITNAVYFKAAWAAAFDPKLTRDAAFHVTAEHTVQVPMMHKSGEFQLGSIDQADVLALPYTGGALRMLVLLPKQDVASLERDLGAPLLAKARASLQAQQCGVALPRFHLQTAYPLHEKVLPALGMKAPFAPSRDWSPLNGGQDPLCVSAVFHNAFVDVDEQGTEAAAATAIVMKRGGRPQQFTADRPFVFVIEHRDSGLLLFVGRVVDPSPVAKAK